MLVPRSNHPTCKYWPSVRISTPASRKSCIVCSTSASVSPSPSMIDDFVTMPCFACLACFSTDMLWSYLDPPTTSPFSYSIPQNAVLHTSGGYEKLLRPVHTACARGLPYPARGSLTILCSRFTVSMLWAKTSRPEVATVSTAAKSPLKSDTKHSTNISSLISCNRSNWLLHSHPSQSPEQQRPLQDGNWVIYYLQFFHCSSKMVATSIR